MIFSLLLCVTFIVVSPCIKLVKCHGSYRALLPNGYRVQYYDTESKSYQRSAGFGHTNPKGHGERNQFGLDFADNGYVWDKTLCKKDSDGDKLTNGEELGDPECVWVIGATPKESVNITHPGIKTDPNFASPPDIEESEDVTTVSFSSLSKLLIFHCMIMPLTWGLMIPIAMLIPVVYKAKKNPWWFNWHRVIMTTCVGLVILGLVAAVWWKSSYNQSHFSSTHNKVGLFLLLLLLVQPINGLVRPSKPTNTRAPKSGIRRIWEFAHSNIGRLMLIISIYVIYSGYNLLSSFLGTSSISQIFQGLSVSICLGAFFYWHGLILYRWRMKKQSIVFDDFLMDHGFDQDHEFSSLPSRRDSTLSDGSGESLL